MLSHPHLKFDANVKKLGEAAAWVVNFTGISSKQIGFKACDRAARRNTNTCDSGFTNTRRHFD